LADAGEGAIRGSPALARAKWLLGDADAGIEELRAGLRQRNGTLTLLAVDFYCDCFRTHPAFESLLGELGLPPRPVIVK
ncbi:MAG TPA: hypothetical protein VNH46_09210, partial [Gemmatimonadales bacterium]|nr:hypothetical protein [Gemmatimonadales bacterium]